MLRIRCIDKIKDKYGNIVQYSLMDNDLNIKDVDAEALKQAIINKKVLVTNLKLTSDNRLIDAPDISYDERIQQLISKAKLLGKSIVEVETGCRHKCYIIVKGNDSFILCIPDNVTCLNKSELSHDFTPNLFGIPGHLKVVGGAGLKNCSYMFKYCKFSSYDFTEFYTGRVVTMNGMFESIIIDELDLSNFDTYKVTSMDKMFFNSCIPKLNISSFDTTNVLSMAHMFAEFETNSIDLRHFNTSRVQSIYAMFNNCKCNEIIMDSLNLKKITYFQYTFARCEASEISLMDVQLAHKIYTKNMFDDCKSKVLTNNKQLEEVIEQYMY